MEDDGAERNLQWEERVEEGLYKGLQKEQGLPG